MPHRKPLAIQEPFKRYSVDLKVRYILLACFICLKESTFGTRKNVSTSEALFVLQIIRFDFLSIQMP